MIAGSIAGTIVGGGATVGTAQLAYTCGLSAWWFTLGSGIAFIIMGLFYASRLRGTGLATIPEFLAAHYGTRAEEASSLIASAGMFFSVVASVRLLRRFPRGSGSDPRRPCHGLHFFRRHEERRHRRHSEDGHHLFRSLRGRFLRFPRAPRDE